MSRTIRFVDQTLRDGQQSWWGMRMPFAISMALSGDLDRAGTEILVGIFIRDDGDQTPVLFWADGNFAEFSND